MPLVCLSYIAKLGENGTPAAITEHKDTHTRMYGSLRITGIRLIASGHVLEIVEGDYAVLESLVDRHIARKLIVEPEILLLAGIRKHVFNTWKLTVLPDHPDPDTDFHTLLILAQQTQSVPTPTPAMIMKLVQHFQQQFSDNSDSSQLTRNPLC